MIDAVKIIGATGNPLDVIRRPRIDRSVEPCEPASGVTRAEGPDWPGLTSRIQGRTGYWTLCDCDFLGDCWGEWPETSCPATRDGEPTANHLCRRLKRFFAHTVPEVEK
jgi:hypothetical protein